MNNTYREVVDITTSEVIQLPADFVNTRTDYTINNKNQDKAYQYRLQRA